MPWKAKMINPSHPRSRRFYRRSHIPQKNKH
nr:MAG TPA: hypothetical protein [Caudoviricetes sp.]